MLFSPTGLSECLREWEDLEKNYQQIQDTHRLYKQKLEEVTKLQDSCSGAIARQRKKLKELNISLRECKENHPTPKVSAEEMDSIAEIEDSMKERANAFSEMEAFLPKKNGGRNHVPSITSAAPFSPAEGSGVIIVVIILCLLLLAILGSVLYFLHKKGKIPCGRSGKQDITKEKTTKDDIVVEMKTNTKNEEAVLLKAVNGDKKGPNEQ